MRPGRPAVSSGPRERAGSGRRSSGTAVHSEERHHRPPGGRAESQRSGWAWASVRSAGKDKLRDQCEEPPPPTGGGPPTRRRWGPGWPGRWDGRGHRGENPGRSPAPSAGPPRHPGPDGPREVRACRGPTTAGRPVDRAGRRGCTGNSSGFGRTKIEAGGVPPRLLVVRGNDAPGRRRRRCRTRPPHRPAALCATAPTRPL